MNGSTKHRSEHRKGFSLVEMIVGLAIFALLGITANLVMNAALTQFARGFSLNQSGDDARAVMDQVARRLESAAETPELVNLSNNTTLVTTTNKYAMGIRYHRLLPGTYQLTGPVGFTNGSLTFTSNSTNELYVQYDSTISPDFSSTTNGGQNQPTIGDRFIVMNLVNYRENITNGSSPGFKPGRGISTVGTLSGTTQKTQRFRITSTTSNSLVISNVVYFAREAAILAVDVTNAGVVRRELRYYDRASSLSNYSVLMRYMDANPVEKDSTGTLILPFTLDTSMSPTALMFHAPVKVTDYARRLGSRKASNEFNSFVRTQSAIIRKDMVELPAYK